MIIIATKEKEKALTGLMYAKNAIENNWLEGIKVIFFGPSESLMIDDEEIRDYAINIADKSECLACKFISDEEEISSEIKELGVGVEYVGSIISDLIEKGYVPMVW